MTRLPPVALDMVAGRGRDCKVSQSANSRVAISELALSRRRCSRWLCGIHDVGAVPPPWPWVANYTPTPASPQRNANFTSMPSPLKCSRTHFVIIYFARALIIMYFECDYANDGAPSCSHTHVLYSSRRRYRLLSLSCPSMFPPALATPFPFSCCRTVPMIGYGISQFAAISSRRTSWML